MHLKKNMNRVRQLEPGTRNMNMKKKATFEQNDTVHLDDRRQDWSDTSPKVTPCQIHMIPCGEAVVECVTQPFSLDFISVKS